MSSDLNLSLTDELRSYVDERTSDTDLYETPGEYIRDLIRHDMQEQAVANQILQGLNDLKQGNFSPHSKLDINKED